MTASTTATTTPPTTSVNLGDGPLESGPNDCSVSSGVVPVVPVVFDDSSDASEPIAPSHEAYGRGTLGLCPPPAPKVVSVVFEGSEQSFSPDSPVADDSDGSDEPVQDSEKTLETLALLAAVGTDDDPYKDGGPWAYADGENAGGRVFFITQNLKTDAGAHFIDAEQIERGVNRKGMTRWAWILHDKDTYTAEEAKKNPRAVEGEPKADHFHVAVERKSFATMGVIARAFGVPPQQVEVKPAGSFLDFVEYLTHEHPNQQAKGKHLYPDEEVHANFDWRPELDDHKLARSFKAGQRAHAKVAAKVFAAVGGEGMRLSEVREKYPDLYFAKGTIAHLQKLRGDYLAQQAAPESVMNFYVFGDGGTGKDLLAKALARSLAPEVTRPYFKVGGENVSFEGYDGEPVIIWEEMRAADMVRVAKGRGMLFRILGPWREPEEKPVVNIKGSHTQLLNRINIVTGPQDYEDFLKGLAGEYQSMQSGILVRHEAENLAQGFRRFPLIIPVGQQEFGIYVNLGVLRGTREFESYEKFEHFSQDLQTVRRRVKAIADLAQRERTLHAIESRTVAPIVRQHDRILAPPHDPATAEEVLAEFADVGQPIPEEELEERRLEALWHPSEEAFFITDERNASRFNPQPITYVG